MKNTKENFVSNIVGIGILILGFHLNHRVDHRVDTIRYITTGMYNQE